MKQILLRDKLVEDLESVATEQTTTSEEILDKLVSQFLYQTSLKKMQAETAAFQQMHEQLVANYFGSYVAIHNGQLIDHDVDATQLRLRIRQKWGSMPMLIRQVTHDKSVPVFKFRSPKRVVIYGKTPI